MLEIPWLITTSCLISEALIFVRTSVFFHQGFKLSVKDLDIQPRVLAWIYRLAEVLGIIYPTKGFINSCP